MTAKATWQQIVAFFIAGGIIWGLFGVSVGSGTAWLLRKCGFSWWTAGPVAVLVGAFAGTRILIFLSSPLQQVRR